MWVHSRCLPRDANRGYVGQLYEESLKFTELRPLLRQRPRTPVSSLGQLWWETDEDVDLEYHVRPSALPAPGRVRELLALVSRLHGSLLDRHRPLWEFHLIEGLEGRRFATYTKIHHSLVDGVAGMRLLTKSLTEDPDATIPPFWADRDRGTEPTPEPDGETSLGERLLGPVRSAGESARGMVVTTANLTKLGCITPCRPRCRLRGRTSYPAAPMTPEPATLVVDLEGHLPTQGSGATHRHTSLAPCR